MTITDPRTVVQHRQPLLADAPALVPVLDLTIPVYNDEARLEASLRRLHSHLMESLPHAFRITIADNASTDATLRIAERLARELPELWVVRFQDRGRGNALRQVWQTSPSPILAYMEADLPADLSALAPLLAPLFSGHSDVAVGTRLAPASHSNLSPLRQFISRSYNALLRTLMGAHVSDAQCAFKAIRADAARKLLPYIKDDRWFFDTELMIDAELCGLRVHEVPVDWTDDPNSSVDVVRTAFADLRGVARLMRDLAGGRVPVRKLRTELGAAAATGSGIPGRVLRALGWAAVCVAAFLLWCNLLGAFPAALTALVLTALAARVAGGFRTLLHGQNSVHRPHNNELPQHLHLT
ncbi:glycosyltransferase [Paenarthrobacter histidinolovorans]|uniref:glycosyltransferase n=1 Tax=Paenarthrobacter histidinolovorans TaxID=43664 RepID=UPI00166D2213|nr:glycosyltransferase [Paenarthrobacter histidinolovorans]GGJ31059.1 sugar translocase [Paenarthrobacter histidinolovorans]